MSNFPLPAKAGNARQWATRVFYTHLTDGMGDEQTHELRLPLYMTKMEVEELIEAIRHQFETVD